MHGFTKKKFLSLPIEQQHKKCAELLRQIYERKTPLEAYTELAFWMGLKDISNDAKVLSDTYHLHLNQAKRQVKEHHLLPTIRQVDRSSGEEPWPIAIFLDHIRSAHNVGSIVRTTEAFSLGTLYFSKQTPFIDNKQVKDTAMGTELWTSCHQDIPLKSLPKPIIALETSDEATSLYDFTFPESFTLVLGNEEYGCSKDSLTKADYLVEIPLRGRKNSLNVANAYSIAAAEITRQKTRMCHEKA